jgi:predicted small metal-binding protein
MKNALACADLGLKDCSFEARSEKKGEVIEAVLGHAQKHHVEVVSGMSDKDKASMDQKIRTV